MTQTIEDVSETKKSITVDWRSLDLKESNLIHAAEYTELINRLSKRKLTQLRSILDSSWNQAPIFGLAWEYQHKIRYQETTINAIVGKLDHTQQKTFYCASSGLAELLEDKEVNDTFVLENICGVSNDPNDIFFSMRQSQCAIVLNGIKEAIPVASYWDKTASYVLPNGIEFVIDKVSQESWRCRQQVSCPTDYQNITVYYVTAKDTK